LEAYPIPGKLVGQMTSVGAVPRRLTPIFRDRDELPASGDLGSELTGALREAMFLLVICSPASAKSRWVGEEILAFKRMHGENRVLALIVDGEPYDLNRPDGGEVDCFPAGLRFRLGPDGALSNVASEPIAADIRKDKDGRRLAKLKLVAGLTGLRLDDLARREAQRRAQRMTVVAGAAVAGMVVTGGLALYANLQRIEAVKQRQIAQRETAAARATTDYLIGTFAVTNPATENPRTISAVTILTRSAQRARTELAAQPAIQSRLLAVVGKAYNNLGLLHESEALLTEAAPAIRRAGPDGAEALMQLTLSYLNQGRLGDARGALRQAELALGPDQTAHLELRGYAAELKGHLAWLDGDPRGGVASIDAALDLYRRSPDIQVSHIADALKLKGLALSDDGQFAKANATLLDALAIYRRVSGENSLNDGKTWYSLALNDLAANDFRPADLAINRALKIEHAVLDADNPLLADALSMQGQIFQAEHKLDAAASALSAAIATYRKAYGRPGFQTGIALVYLALVESDRGHLKAALTDLDDAKHNYDVGYGKLHPNHGDLLVNRATILARFGRRREALADCAAGIKILDQTLGADASFTRQDAGVCGKL